MADDPLESKTGTEDWDREEELKKQALIEAQRKRLALDDFQKTKSRVANQLYEWQKDLSKFQEIKRSIADILFQEEAKAYQQVNVKEKVPPKEVKHMPAKGSDLSIETGGPIIEKQPSTKPQETTINPVAPVTTTQPTVVQPPVKKEAPPEPTSEDILKKQKGHFDDKGQFIDEELKQESKDKPAKDKDVDYDNP